MNVLLLSDFSPVAINATHYAMDVLQDKQVNFYLLNIFDPDPDDLEKFAGAGNLTISGKLKERVEKLQQRSKGRQHKITGHYSEEKLVNKARDFVQQHKIDLIVMGAVGREQSTSSILGRHTFEIMSKIKCNILAVAEGSEYKKPKKLIMPLDYTASFGEKNISFLKNSGVFNKVNLDVWELAGSGDVENLDHLEKKGIFSALKDLNIKFSPLQDSAFTDKTIWMDVQNKFHLIVLLGKNLRICDRLLHNRHGLYATVPNQLPILVLHD
ncbi:universal stress protein [Antarcticibacterium sp. 1MA-6-2]|uniref:universal stress protein n=1 Tax=Antarcticibacterium sp. 1MA-6-2 TaxID=2908210 RepID=UPI001F44BB34|nr:universal stress protein [Antarcticibacterium sp. 1MA-6-2]UJH92886.1 universal stress protein [Antarcticibacterium sp. 1MA-6-2]